MSDKCQDCGAEPNQPCFPSCPQITDSDSVEVITNDLIAVIWPLLNSGISKDEVRSYINNVLDSWTPENK